VYYYAGVSNVTIDASEAGEVIIGDCQDVNVIDFEACNMASIEVMNDLVGVTDYAVASETYQYGGDGYPPYPLAILIDDRRHILKGRNLRELARQVCHRNRSVGADGLIVIVPPSSRKALGECARGSRACEPYGR
jgi:hypothetical protein